MTSYSRRKFAFINKFRAPNQGRKVFLFKKGDIASARNDLKIRQDNYLTNNRQVFENYYFLTETVLEVMKETFHKRNWDHAGMYCG